MKEKMMEMAKALMAMASDGGAPAVAEPVASGGGSDIDERISQLAEAVKTVVDGNLQLAEIVKKLSSDVEHFGAFTGAWDGMAKEKDRNDGIEGMKGKYGSHADYGPIASAFEEVEGKPIWENLYDTLSQAKDEASKAADGSEFNEDEFIGGHFKSIGDVLGRAAAAHEKIKPVAAEISVATAEPEKPETTPEPPVDEFASEEGAFEAGKRTGERVRERKNSDGKK